MLDLGLVAAAVLVGHQPEAGRAIAEGGQKIGTSFW